MGKKVLNRSNKNIKLRSILDASLKVNLDKEEFVNDWRFSNVALSVGALGIVSSCGNDKDKNPDNGDKTKLKWSDFKDKDKFDNDEEKFNKFIEKCGKLSKEEIENLIKQLDKKDIKNIINSNEVLKKDSNGNIQTNGRTIDVNGKTEPTTTMTQNNSNFDHDKLTEEQKGTLKGYGIDNKEDLNIFFNIKGNEVFKNKKISDLFNGKDIKDNDFKAKLESYKKSKEAGEIKEILKSIMSDNDIDKFLKYVKYIDDNLEKKHDEISKSIKDNKDKKEEIEKTIKNFCKRYVKEDGNVNYAEIVKILNTQNNILMNSIRENIKGKLEDGQNVSNLKFTCSKGDDCIKLKITHNGKDKNNDDTSVELEIKFGFEELLKIKEKDKEIQLYRIKDGDDGIKYEIDDDKATEIKNLFPKKNDDTATNTIKAIITTELRKSLKDGNNNISLNSFANVAKVLKSLIITAQKLNTGKINENGTDKWIYSGVSSVNDLDNIFGKKDDYAAAIKAEFDAIIKKIKEDIGEVSSGELTNNVKDVVDLKLSDDGQKTSENKKIFEAINEYLKESGEVIKKYWADAGPAKYDGKANGNVKAKIVFGNDGKVTNIVIPTTAETITQNGLVLFLEATPNTTKIKAVIDALEAKLQDFIKGENGETKVQFVSDGTEKCLKKISDFIDKDLTYDKIKVTTFDIKAVEDTALKNICGVGNTGISKNEDVKTKIVEPLMKKVFGDANKVKNLFDAINALSVIKVGKDDDSSLLYIGADGSLAGIKRTDNGATGDTVDDAKKMTSPDKLKNAVLLIGEKLKECQGDSSSHQAFKNLLEEYFGIGGEGKESTLQAKVPCAKWLPNNEKWIKLGKLLMKWLFVKNVNTKNQGWTGNTVDNEANYKKKQLKDYDDSALGLAMGILFLGKNVQQKDSDANKENDLHFWTDNNNALKINLGKDDGIGGKNISDSSNTGAANKVDFDNIIWCQSLPAKYDDVIGIKTKQNSNVWTKDDELVYDTLSDNIGNNVNFIYILLSLGLVKSTDGKVVDELTMCTKSGVANKFIEKFGELT